MRFLLFGGNHGLIARRIIKSYNVFRNYYKKGEESDISIVLELSVVFSQIIYFKNRQFEIENIRQISKECVNYHNNEEYILKEFVKNIMVEIFLIDTKVAPSLIIDAVNNKSTLIERIIRNNLGKISGNKLLYRRTINFIYRNPNCWNGIYNEIQNVT